MSLSLLDSLPDLLTPPEGDEWAWWNDALAGRPGKFEPLVPNTGFYRFRPRKSDRGEPCAIYFEHGRWWCLLGDRVEDDVAYAWRWAHQQPVSHELYQAVLAGAPWPDEIAAQVETPAAGHNSAQPEALALDQIAAADAAFATWLEAQGGVIRTEEHDQIAKGYDDRIAKLRKNAEAARKAEKDEYLRGGQAIDAKWSPVKAAAVAAEGKISAAVTPYRGERKRIIDEAAKAEREARAAARAAGTPEPSRNGAKPATGLRKIESAVVDDLPKLAAALAGLSPPPPDLVDVCRKAAERILKAGALAPGARLVTTYKA